MVYRDCKDRCARAGRGSRRTDETAVRPVVRLITLINEPRGSRCGSHEERRTQGTSQRMRRKCVHTFIRGSRDI